MKTISSTQSTNVNADKLTLVVGGTGKTGSRVATRLAAKNVPLRLASRTGTPAFDWNNSHTWDQALAGVHAVYISFSPDLAIPGATEVISAFVDRAVRLGVQRIVLLSGRGEEEAQRCERLVQNSGIQWTVVRASWFNQNFSEGEFLSMVQAGEITLPAADIAEPFVDVDDIADVAVAALTEPGHHGQVYEVTGPRLLTFKQVARELSQAAGRDIRFVPISSEVFTQAVAQSGAPQEMVWLMGYLFENLLDGRNAWLGDGVQRALGRQPVDISEYAARVAATGLWRVAA